MSEVVAECPRCGHKFTREDLKSLWGRYTGALARLERPIVVQEDSCREWLTEDEVRSLWGRYTASLRVTRGAGTGRPRSRKKRCPCGANTMKRAEARSFYCCKAAGLKP